MKHICKKFNIKSVQKIQRKIISNDLFYCLHIHVSYFWTELDLLDINII